jgi:hypothetical protein
MSSRVESICRVLDSVSVSAKNYPTVFSKLKKPFESTHKNNISNFRNDHRTDLNESNSYQSNFVGSSNNQNTDSILESQCIGRKTDPSLAEYDCLNDLSILHSNDKSSNQRT